MVTLAECEQAASELRAGPQRPSLLLALWASILSPQKNVRDNGSQASALRAYVRAGLPSEDIDDLRALLKRRASGYVYANHLRAVIQIERLYRAGLLSGLETRPTSGRAWVLWRKQVANLPGLSWKTASFTALLMWPDECPFVPVDSHVCKRMGVYTLYETGVFSRKSKTGYTLYREIERQVRQERAAAGVSVSVTVWHWYKWEKQRQSTGHSRAIEGAESHAGLNVRSY